MKKSRKQMIEFFKNISVLGIASFILALGMSSAMASYEPSTSPGSAYELITPNFNALLIGRGTDPTSNGDLKIMGNTTVIGDVITDTLDSYSGGEITSSANIVAPAFGDVYYLGSTPTDNTSSSGIFSATKSCASGDLMLSCNGYLTSPSTSGTGYFGSEISKTVSTSTYTCTAKAGARGVIAQTVCWSPSDDSGTNTDDI